MHRYLTVIAAAALLASCTSHHEPEQASALAGAHTAAPAPAAKTPAADAAARAVVDRFGRQMQKISVLAPPEAVRDELPKVYGRLLSAGLLARWRAHPNDAIGREGSSPWPDHIAVHTVDCHRPDACRVTGEVAYITSNEVEHGGVAMRRPIALDVTHTTQGWRIDSVELAPPASG